MVFAMEKGERSSSMLQCRSVSSARQRLASGDAKGAIAASGSPHAASRRWIAVALSRNRGDAAVRLAESAGSLPTLLLRLSMHMFNGLSEGRPMAGAQWRTTSSHELARASKGRRSVESACLQRHIVGRRASAVIIQRTWTPQHLNRPAHTSFVSHMDTPIVPFLCCTSPKSRSTKHTPASTGRRVRSILTLQLAPA